MDPSRTGQAPRLSLGTPYRRKESASVGAPEQSGEAAVRATDTDALFSRISAVQAGYVAPDAYAALFVAGQDAPSRRPLLINIGTALRSGEVDARVHAFLQSASLQIPSNEQPVAGVQILSLGAGSDTRFWRLSESDVRTPSLTQKHLAARVQRYVEVDYAQITANKASAIRKHDELRVPLGTLKESENESEIHSATYVLLAEDLHTLGGEAPMAGMDRLLAQLDPNVPTLLLWECVLAYMDPSAANRFLGRLFSYFPHVAILCYDMCISGDHAEPGAPPDRFGRMMLQNLSARRLELPGARKYTTPASYAERFQRLLQDAHEKGTVHSDAYSLRRVWLALDGAERHRLSRLEGLDEVEELEMLLGHYCMSWAERIL